MHQCGAIRLFEVDGHQRTNLVEAEADGLRGRGHPSATRAPGVDTKALERRSTVFNSTIFSQKRMRDCSARCASPDLAGTLINPASVI